MSWVHNFLKSLRINQLHLQTFNNMQLTPKLTIKPRKSLLIRLKKSINNGVLDLTLVLSLVVILEII